MQREWEAAGIIGMLRRRRLLIILPFGCTVFLGIVFAMLLPNVYRSSAVILVENPRIPSTLVSSTVTGFAEQRIHAITQEMTSRTAILELASKYDLLPKKREGIATEDLVQGIRKRIIVEPLEPEIKRETLNKPLLLNIAFRLSFDDEDPARAMKVAAEISSHYMDKNAEEREKHVRATSKFLADQLQQARNRLDELESKLADYREQHLEELPEFTALNMQKLEKLNSDISSLNLQVRSMEEQRSLTRNRLAVIDPWSSDKVLSSEERLQQVQIERAVLMARYTDKHPLVQAKNQEMMLLGVKSCESSDLTWARDRLRQVRLEAGGLNARYTDRHPEAGKKLHEIESIGNELAVLESRTVQTRLAPGERPTNPAYVALQADLDRLDVSISSSKREIRRFEKQVLDLYGKLRSMPRVSREYNELTTDCQNAKAQYVDLQQKYSAARISQGMEEEQLGEMFRIVEAPFCPEKPIRPNRLAIVVVGILMGLGISLGCASVAEYLSKSVHGNSGRE